MDDDGFDEIFASVEQPLRRALVAWYGPDVGRDAAAYALGWAWENRDHLGTIANLPGYLFRVGQSSAKIIGSAAPCRGVRIRVASSA